MVSDELNRVVLSASDSYGTESAAPASLPTLHFFCGKIGAGKSTLARELAKSPQTILISEDAWLAQLFPGEIRNAGDFSRCADRLRFALTEHIAALLGAGLSVALDLPANTPAVRQWLRRLIDRTGVNHQLHYLDPPDEACKTRLQHRNEAGDHPFLISDEQFDEITHYFVPPREDEGFNIVRH